MLGAQPSTADGRSTSADPDARAGLVPRQPRRTRPLLPRAVRAARPRRAGSWSGPAADAPARVAAVAGAPRAAGAPAVRATGGRRAAAAAETDVLDAHFALYAAAPLLLAALRGAPRRVPLPRALGGGEPRRGRHLARAASPAPGARAPRAAARRRACRPLRRLPARARRALRDRPVADPRLARPASTLERVHARRPRARRGRGSARARGASWPSARGAWSPRMGIDVLLDAWARLAGACPRARRCCWSARGRCAGELDERAAQGAAGADGVRVLGPRLRRAARRAPTAPPTWRSCRRSRSRASAWSCSRRPPAARPSIVTDVGGLPRGRRRARPLADRRRRRRRRAGRAAARGRRRRAAGRARRPGATPSSFDWASARASATGALYRAPAGRRAPTTRPRVVYLDHVARLSGGEIALLRLLPHLRRVNAHVILGEDGPLAAAAAAGGRSRSRCCRSPPPPATCARTAVGAGRRLPGGRAADARLRAAPGAAPAPPATGPRAHQLAEVRRLRRHRRARWPACPSSGTCATASPRTTCRGPAVRADAVADRAGWPTACRELDGDARDAARSARTRGPLG